MLEQTILLSYLHDSEPKYIWANTLYCPFNIHEMRIQQYDSTAICEKNNINGDEKDTYSYFVILRRGNIYKTD